MSHRPLILTALLTLGLAAPQATAAVTGGGGPGVPATATVQGFRVTAPDGWVFQGELTLPPGARAGQNFPTVLLVHGSGPNDMNETVSAEEARSPGGSANFLTIARRLNAAGFAVARFNKRGVTGVGPRTVPPEEMTGVGYTPTGIAGDALRILQHVRRQPQVDPSRVFLLGHSEGTDIVSKLAADHRELVRGVVAIGVSGDSSKDSLRLQIVDNQVGYARKFDRDRDGVLSAAEVNAVPGDLRVWLRLWEAMGLIGPAGRQYRLTPALDPEGRQEVEISGQLRAFLAGYFDRTYPDFLFMGPHWGAYMRDAERFGFTTTLLPRYPGPVLMMNGDRDDQTPLGGAVRAYEAVRRSGNADVTLKVYPGTGHTLAPLRDGVTTLGPMSEQALTDLTLWLKARAR